jgi:flagellar protein FlaH
MKAAAPGAPPLSVVFGGDRRIISTGSVEIDKKMAGGIPEGSLVLIEGQSSAGKSVVTQQLLNGALNGGFRCVLYTTENTASSLFRQMASLDLDVTDFFLLGALNVYHAPVAMAPEMAKNIFEEMLDHIASLLGRFDVVFIDSLTSFVSQVPEQVTLSFLTQVKQFCDRDMTIFFTIHSYALEESMFMRMRSLCDVYLRLRVEEVGDQLMKVLEVAKVRGAEKNTGNIVNFAVEPGIGMRIIPVSSARA